METYRERNASAPSLLIAAHCSTIQRKANDLDTNELSSILDDLIRELNVPTIRLSTYIYSLNKILKVLNSSFPPVLTQISSHYFFIIVRNTIRNYLVQLSATKKLNSDEIYVLRNCVLLISYLVEDIDDVSKILHWITDATFLDALANVLIRIKKVSKKKYHRQAIKQIARLLNIFCLLQERLPVDLHQSLFVRLLKPTIECLKSSTYLKLFQNLRCNAESLTEIEKLYLIKCPYFLTTYEGPRIEQAVDQILDVMLPRYVTIFNHHIKTIKEWKRPIMRAIHNLIITIVYAEGYFGSYTKTYPFRQLIDHLFTILSESTLINKIHPTSNNIETLLIDATLVVFTVLVYESNALDYIKRCAPINVFRQLTKVSNETIVLNAYMMLAYTIDDQDMRTVQDDLTKLLSTTFNLLKKTIEKIESNSNQANLDRNLIQLLETLKGLAQYEQIQHEILKQGIIPFLIDSYKKVDGLSRQVLLECLWKFSFNEETAQELRKQTQFIELLANLPKPVQDNVPQNALRRSNSYSSRRNSMSASFMEATNYGIQKVADGILWKLKKEPQFRAKATQHGTMSDSGLPQKFKYNIMISHSPADKEIVLKLQKLLGNEGYKVWFDRDHNHGQAMETVAEVIDNSEFVIICISDSYKRDNYCQAQAEYALNSKRQILPLIIHKDCKPDGWVIPLINDNDLIDFGTSNFKIPLETLLKEIKQRQCKKEIVDVKPTTTSTTTHSTLPEVSDSLDHSITSSETTRDQQTVTTARTVSKPTTPADDASAVSRAPPRSSVTNVARQQEIPNPPVSASLASNLPSPHPSVIVNRQSQSTVPENPNVRIPVPASAGIDNRSQREPSNRSVSRSPTNSSVISSGSFNVNRQQQPTQRIANNPMLRSYTPSSISSDVSVITGSAPNNRQIPPPPQGPLQSILKSKAPVPVLLNTPVSIERNQKQQQPATLIIRTSETPITANTVPNNRQLPPPQQQPALSVIRTSGTSATPSTVPNVIQQPLPQQQQQQQQQQWIQSATQPLINGTASFATSSPANTVPNNRQLPPPQQQQQRQSALPVIRTSGTGATPSTVPNAIQQQPPQQQQQQQQQQTQSTKQPLTNGTAPSAISTAANTAQQQQMPLRLVSRSPTSESSSSDEDINPNKQQQLQPQTQIRAQPPVQASTTNIVTQRQAPTSIKNNSNVAVPNVPYPVISNTNINQQRQQTSTNSTILQPVLNTISSTPVTASSQQQQTTLHSTPKSLLVATDIPPTSVDTQKQQQQVTPRTNTASTTPASDARISTIPNERQTQQQQQQRQAPLRTNSRPPTPGSSIHNSNTTDQRQPQEQQRAPSRALSRPTTPATSAAIAAVTNERSVTPVVRPTSTQPNSRVKPRLPDEYTKRKTENSTYRNTSTETWKHNDVLDYLFDVGLYSMMPLCETMSGKALLRLFRMCQRKPSRLYDQLNDELRTRFNGLNLSMGTYTQFLIEMDTLFSSIADAFPSQLDSMPKIIERVIYVPHINNETDRLPISTQPSPGPSISIRTPVPPHALKTSTPFESSSGATTPRSSTRIIEKVVYRTASNTGQPNHFIA